MQAVADPRLTVDRHARSAEIGDVPVNRALADLEPLRELRGRRQAAAAQVLDDLEQPIRTPHGQQPSGSRHTPYCQLVAVWIEKVEAPAAREAEDLPHDAAALR